MSVPHLTPATATRFRFVRVGQGNGLQREELASRPRFVAGETALAHAGNCQIRTPFVNMLPMRRRTRGGTACDVSSPLANDLESALLRPPNERCIYCIRIDEQLASHAWLDDAFLGVHEQ